MRILVVGTGSIGARHARVIHGAGGHELILADTRQDALDALSAELPGVATLTDYREALNLEPDAAIICTPNSLHADMAVECAQAGCHLLVEKPIAHTVSAAQRIVQAARDCRRVVAVGYVLRFWPGVDEIKRLIRSGRIGVPLCARVMVGAYETLTYARTSWRAEGPAEGGPLLDYSHEIDYLRWYMGEVAQVACMTARLGPDAESLVTAALCNLRFDSGALGELHIDYLQHPARRELDVVGQDGRLFFDFRTMRLALTNPEGQCHEQTWTAERNEAFLKQFQAFEAACLAKAPVAVDAQNATRTLAVALAAIDSARSSRFVDLQAP